MSLRVGLDSLTGALGASTARGDSLERVARVALERLDVTAGVVVDLRSAIAKLTTRKWQDYVAAGCGFGVRGVDCIVGVRVPIGR